MTDALFNNRKGMTSASANRLDSTGKVMADVHRTELVFGVSVSKTPMLVPSPRPQLAEFIESHRMLRTYFDNTVPYY
jgi:hypothetical protein